MNYFSFRRFIAHILLAGVVQFTLLQSGMNTVLAAENTTPPFMIYEGVLMNSARQPLSGEYNFRFSLWSDADVIPTDISSGAINPLASTFLGWEEVQQDTLDIRGAFSLEMGQVEPIDFSLFHRNRIYLQVEIKPINAPDTDYEILDVDSVDDAVDRMIVDTIPYAYNADKIDYRDVGFDPENIPHLDEQGLLNQSVFPTEINVEGTPSETFTIDSDSSAAPDENVELVFGDTLQKKIAWEGLIERFVFNDDVEVRGDLIVQGSINGVPIGQRSEVVHLLPRYPNSVFNADGTNNQGEMHEESETILSAAESFLRWTTWEATPQDYDVLIQHTLPQNFVEWDTSAPITVTYKTDGTNVQSYLNITAAKSTNNGTDLLNNAGAQLSQNTWTATPLMLDTGTNWSAGETVLIKVNMSASEGFDARVGKISLNYTVGP